MRTAAVSRRLVPYTHPERLVVLLATLLTAGIVFADVIGPWIPEPLRSPYSIRTLVAVLMWVCVVLFLRFKRLQHTVDKAQPNQVCRSFCDSRFARRAIHREERSA